MVQHLPSELLQKIFSYFSPEDIKILHACILVNRQWCRNAVALLWLNPFLTSSSPKIISTYVSFLSDDVKKNVGIRESEYCGHSLFDYPAFLREFDFKCVNRAVSAWLLSRKPLKEKNMCDSSDKSDNAKSLSTSLLLFQEICKVLLTRSRHISSFTIDVTEFDPSADLLYQTINLCEINLSRLGNLVLSGNFNKSRVLCAFDKVSRNIRSLTIAEDTRNGPSTEVVTPMQPMADFITAQHRLTEFTLEQCIHFTDILPALTTQEATLTHVIFRNCWFRNHIIGDALSNLRGCKNLVSLRFEQCFALINNVLKPLSKVRYPKLEYFEYSPQAWSYSEWDHFSRELPKNELSSFLSINGSHLKELKLGNMLHCCPELIEDVVLYGSNLRTLEVNMNNLERQIFPILLACRRLERLTVPKVSRAFRCDVDYLLPDIGRRMPSSLSHLDLRGWPFAPSGLKSFLQEFGKQIKFLAWNDTASINRYSGVIKEYTGTAGGLIKKLHMQGACDDNNDPYVFLQAIHEFD
ncbi:4054_t:CDS:1 [Acaulospora morrowiae]|uniref:4054_t:CDS:1 n=1 Tax=Acaulospora morrowiae TaxID=94023 RepID=A0A9N9EAG5_9GLOM|nr:4054_t:CDS:1 [Acaulospora morrowiae]